MLYPWFLERPTNNLGSPNHKFSQIYNYLKKSLKNRWQLGLGFKFLKEKKWVWKKIAYFNSFRCFYNKFFAFCFVLFFWQNMNSLAQMCILITWKTLFLSVHMGWVTYFHSLCKFFGHGMCLLFTATSTKIFKCFFVHSLGNWSLRVACHLKWWT